MNIADFATRGNPEDWDDELGPIGAAEAPKTAPKVPGVTPKRGTTPKNALIIGILLLTSSASFGLGLLAGQGTAASSANAGGLIIGTSAAAQPASAILSTSALSASGVASASSTGATGSNGAPIPVGGEVVGDNSAHTYYLPWCPQVAKISNADTVWFATEQMAKSAGYTAGPNCPGI